MGTPLILQDEQEIDALADLVAQEQCASLLEIGAKFGGSLWRLAQAMQPGARIVAIDLPEGTRAWRESERSLLSCMESLKGKGYDTHTIWGDSIDARIIDCAAALGPYDCVFIDANHTDRYVRSDWKHYAPMARIVAFHDIAWERPDIWTGTRIDVPKVWAELKQQHRHCEFKFCSTGRNNGIGVLWRY